MQLYFKSLAVVYELWLPPLWMHMCTPQNLTVLQISQTHVWCTSVGVSSE